MRRSSALLLVLLFGCADVPVSSEQGRAVCVGKTASGEIGYVELSDGEGLTFTTLFSRESDFNRIGLATR